MATPKENSLSLGHLTGTFAKQRQHRLKKSVNTPMLFQAELSAPQSHQHLRKMHLQQRLRELKERELTARQHNRQLLQQFDEAQVTLRGMFTLTANMKTIRVEYERYLEESAPRWQQQLREQKQAAQRKRMEEVLKSCLKNAEDQVMKSSAESTTKPQKTAPLQKHYGHNSRFDYTQDGPPHLPYMQPPWQTHPHTQTSRFPIRAPHQPQGSSYVPPSPLPPPVFSHPFHLSHHHPWPRQTPPQPDWSWTAAIPPGSEALWGQLYTEEPPPEREAVEMSTAPSSKGERGGGSGSSLLSQELDVKPVRLSGSPAESSDSSRESSQASREKREKRGGSRRPSSDREGSSSQESSGSSSAIVVTAAFTAAKSDASSEKSRTSGRGRRSAGMAAGSPRAEEAVKEGSRSNGEDSESQTTGEESRSELEEGDQSPGAKSLSCREESGSQEEEEEEEEEEESGSVSLKIEEGGGGQSSGSEESGEGVKEEEEAQDKDPGDGDEQEDDGEEEEKEESQGDEKQEVKDVEEEEEEMKEQESEEEGDEEEKSDRLKNEESGGEGSEDEEEDEEESEGEDDKIEGEGESEEEEEEEQRGDEAGEPEERDSEDSIISPQSKTKKMHIIPEEAGEEEEEDEDDEGTTGSSDSNENSDEDIENLLAPQEQSQKKEEKNVKAEEKDKGTCDRVQIFQVETSPKRDHQSDSEEFDDFYD